VFKLSFVTAVLVAATLPGWGQAAVVRPPEMPGVFQPMVGSGAIYQITAAHNPGVQFTYAVVGKQDDAYWLEIRTSTPKGQMIMKQLVSVTGGGNPPHVKRMIIQAAGQPPMELPVSLGNRAVGRAPNQGAANPRELGEKVGMETITVSGGTFECEHYRRASSGKPADLWVSSKVSPYSLVKMTSDETQMELQKVLVNETSRITGEPMKLPSYPDGK
jgi:hypothetical protein